MLEYAAEAQAIKSAIDQGVPPTEPTEIADVTAMGEEEALAYVNSIRPRLYAISAVFGHQILDYSEPSIQGIPATEEKPVCLEDLGNRVFTIIRRSQADYIEERRTEAPFEAWYQEADRLRGVLLSSGIVTPGRYDSMDMLLGAGLASGIDQTVRTLDLVDRAHEQYAPDASEAEITETAVRARSIPYRLARTIPFERLLPALASLGNVLWFSSVEEASAYALDRFTVTPSTKNPNILNIKFDDEVLTDPRDSETTLDSIATKLGHLGCPGLIDFSAPETPVTHAIGRIYRDTLTNATELHLWGKGMHLAPARATEGFF